MSPDDDAALLRQFLTARDIPCPQCTYNLRDLTGSRCPECGEELTLRLQLSEPRQAAALAGVITLAAGAGFNVLLLAFVFIMDPHARDVILATLLIGSVAFLGATALWLKMWRQVRRLGVVRRWVLVATCGILVLADLIIFSKSVG